MDAIQGQAMAQEAERRRAVDIQRTDAALKRIESGDYGYCVQCDDEIAEKNAYQLIRPPAYASNVRGNLKASA